MSHIENDRRWTKLWLWLVLAAGCAAVCGPVLATSGQLYFRDLQLVQYPFKWVVAARLRAGEWPLWDPFTEGGNSILGQLTPGVFHPLTLLYWLVPFDLAFKLNLLAAFPLAAASTWGLSRQVGASPWAAACAGAIYGGSGYLASMVDSNTHYALAMATVPLALWQFLRLAERPGPGRLAAAGAALALCAVAGDPQSMLLAGLIGGVWQMGRAVLTPPSSEGRLPIVAKAMALVLGWGIVAGALSAPATFPAIARATMSTRSHGLGKWDREAFAVSPARLAGLALPWVADDRLERVRAGVDANPFVEYFAGAVTASFSESISLGAVALLLACFGLAAGRRGRAFLATAIGFLLLSTGDRFGLQSVAFGVLPGFRLFRYAEKFIAPASLLLALAAAAGADASFRSPRAARRLAISAALVAAGLMAGAMLTAANQASLGEWLVRHGRTHAAGAAAPLLELAVQSLWVQGGLVATLAGIAALSIRRAGGLPVTALVCLLASLLATAGLLHTAPLSVLRGPFPLTSLLEGRAGPSAGRWRIESPSERTVAVRGIDSRLGIAIWNAKSFAPQTHTLAGIESATPYSSLSDAAYEAVAAGAPEVWAWIIGARFSVRLPAELSASQARAQGFVSGPDGLWIRERLIAPRAFLSGDARAAPSVASALAALQTRGFDPSSRVIVGGGGPSFLPPPPADVRAATARYLRPSAEEIDVETESPSPAVLVISEHYDPGWVARVDGQRVPLARADLAAMAIPVPSGRHRATLRFVPVGLPAGFISASVMLLVLASAGLIRCRRKGARRAPSQA